MMNTFLSEFTGTALLITLGNGVVANVVLPRTKGHSSGWIVISFGWAMAVFVGVYTAAASGAHLNPAISIAFAFLGKITWGSVPVYLAGQMLGAMAGALVVWIVYRQHFELATTGDEKLIVFCTAPAIRSTVNNLLSEIAGTFVLVFGALRIAAPASSLGAIDALPVALLVLAIGLSLGGTTGYAINPARDLGPRLMHFLLPIPKKRDSDWSYSWIPVAGPLVGGLLAALAYNLI
jgi:glycerol uptake facilitator protein